MPGNLKTFIRQHECVQTIPHPTQSVWSVTTLANGDIVTGARELTSSSVLSFVHKLYSLLYNLTYHEVQSVHKKVGSLQIFSGHFVAQSANFIEVCLVNEKFVNNKKVSPPAWIADDHCSIATYLCTLWTLM